MRLLLGAFNLESTSQLHRKVLYPNQEETWIEMKPHAHNMILSMMMLIMIHVSAHYEHTNEGDEDEDGDDDRAANKDDGGHCC